MMNFKEDCGADDDDDHEDTNVGFARWCILNTIFIYLFVSVVLEQ